ncbi:hypothetical protein K501DRAFT_281599 [Backusella circina FSU 941]|nr:hypothetical protein K501DRAFT_281599 [Backusella circina FSU 941]
MMLLEKIYPEDFQADASSLGSTGMMMRHTILDAQNQPILTTRSETLQEAPLANLSREQLIERVLQLEMEKKSRPVKDNMNSFYPSNVVPSVQTNKDEDNDQTNMHSCQWDTCDAKAPTLDRLMTHICDSHIGSGKATYFCEWKNCLRNKKPFMKRHKMHNHMRTHTGERPFVCTITGCNKAFSRPDSLSTHIKTHSDIRPYLCSVPGCEKAYFHSRSLRKHLKSTHMKQSKFSVRNGVPSNVTHRYRIPTTTKRRQTNVDLKSSQLTLSYAPNYATSIFHS